MTGTVTELDFGTYTDLQRVNFSTAKEMDQSPAHYRYRLDHPLAATRAMVLGSAVHAAVLEPDKFRAQYTQRPPGVDLRTKAGKEWKAANASRTILDPDEWQRCIGTRDAVLTDPWAAPYLTDGRAEQTVQWTDSETGLPCKCRIDFVNGRLVDLKTGACVKPRAFSTVIHKYKYHAQGAFYVDGFEAATGERKRFSIIAVEKQPPYVVQVYDFGDEELDIGRELYRSWLRRIAECESRGVWPGYSEGPIQATLPQYAYQQDDDLSDLGLDFGTEDAA